MKRLISVLAMAIFLMMGCGGGGDTPPVQNGGGSDITYTGLVSHATITENNAYGLALRAWNGWIPASALPVPANALATSYDDDDEDDEENDSILDILKALEDLVNQIDIESRSAGSYLSSIYTDTVSIQGNCGGYADITFSIDDKTGELDGYIDLHSYCNLELTMDGHMDFYGYFDPITGWVEAINHLWFDTIDVEFLGDSVTLANGYINYSFPFDSQYVGIGITTFIRDNSNGKVHYFKDYYISLYLDKDEIHVSGIYFDPDYGYVIVEPYHNPIPGLGIEGANGTSAILEFFSDGTFVVSADTNGDGEYDYMSS